MRKRWTTEEISTAIAMQSQGYHMKHISRYFHVTTNALYKMIQRYYKNIKRTEYNYGSLLDVIYNTNLERINKNQPRLSRDQLYKIAQGRL